MRRVTGGFIGPRQRPFVFARVRLPRFRVFADMNLLVDTGADFTSIHWLDRRRLRDAAGSPLPRNVTFTRTGTASGISGSSVAYGIEDAEFFFRTEDNQAHIAAIEVRIALDASSTGIPSLLGRDILSEARLSFDMTADRLILEWPV